MEVDLHLHTTASDGTLTPQLLIDQVATTGLRVVAVTDHDSTEGLNDAIAASAKYPRLTVITGIELGTATEESELHLLGYFINASNPTLQETLLQFRLERVEAARAMVRRLAELQRPVSWDRVVELARGSVGRPHIARAMVEAGHVETVAEAFNRYIGDKGVARVPRPKLHPLGALDLIHSAGGIGVVAHPRTVDRLDELVKQLAGAGLAGIERCRVSVPYGNRPKSTRADGETATSTSPHASTSCLRGGPTITRWAPRTRPCPAPTDRRPTQHRSCWPVRGKFTDRT